MLGTPRCTLVLRFMVHVFLVHVEGVGVDVISSAAAKRGSAVPWILNREYSQKSQCTHFLVNLNVLSENRRKPSIRDQVRIGYGVIREAVELIVNFGQPLLQAADESREWAKAIFVCTTPLDSCQGHDSVVKDPTYVR